MAKAAIAADRSAPRTDSTCSPRSTSRQEQVEDALDALRQTLKLDPRQVGAQIAMARVYASKGQKLPAIEMAQQAVVSAPLNPEARLTLVRAVLATGDAVRANGNSARS